MKTLYGMPHTRSFRALWALEEIGVDYRYQLVDLGKGGGQTPEFQALNPAGKLPVLVDGDLVLSESAAICTYLAECYPHKDFIPEPGTADRARYNQWCFFVLAELEQPLWTMAKHKFALPKKYRVREVLETAAFEFTRAAQVLDAGLAERYFLVGTSFSMADLLVAHTLNWARTFKVKHGIARLDDYLERMTQRQAWQRALAIETEKAGGST